MSGEDKEEVEERRTRGIGVLECNKLGAVDSQGPHIKDCYLCKTDKTAVTRAAPLQPLPFSTEPWKQIGINIVGPINSLPLDCRFTITAVDCFSKWPEVEFVP